MNVVDMNHSFLLKLKTLDRTDIKDPLSYDVVGLLNNAQTIVVDELINNKRYDLLRPITESINITGVAFETVYAPGINADGDSTNVPVRVVKLSTLATSVMSYRSYIRSQSQITRTQTPVVVGAYVQNEEIPKELIADFEINGSNYPIFTNPKCFLEGDYLVVMGDYYTSIVSVQSVVVRHPKNLDLATAGATTVTTCELPTQLHDLIVDKAVQIFNETVNVNDLKKKG